MNPPSARLPIVYLNPGELRIAKDPTIVSMVLGSCISVTMFCRRLRIGAACHAALPAYQGQNTDDNPLRFVDYSIQFMVCKFRQLGIKSSQIAVKLFGGADILNTEGRGNNFLSIGKLNIESAKKTIEFEGLKLLAANTGGESGRKIFFYTDTGEIFLKRLPRRKNISLSS